MKQSAAGIAITTPKNAGRSAAQSHINCEYELNQVIVCPRIKRIVAIINFSYIM
tara:strand:+ start:241 stop:402 length:162 start_codon:yes stop_codon:yes gene_type:complete